MSEQQQTKRAYTFVVEPFDFEVTYAAFSEKEAHRMAWEGLSDVVKNRASGLDLVDEQPIALPA